jgi:hypothetical protein
MNKSITFAPILPTCVPTQKSFASSLRHGDPQAYLMNKPFGEVHLINKLLGEVNLIHFQSQNYFC